MVRASTVSFRQADFVFLSLRALLSPVGAADPRSKAFKFVTIVFFGLLLSAFLAIDRPSLSSYRWSESFFLLVYLAVAVFAVLFRFYDVLLAPTVIARRLRAALRPAERLWIHAALAVLAAGLQIRNYQTAAVDVTFGSNELYTFLGVTTSATGWYQIFGASVLAYCGLVLLIKLSLIYAAFGRLFERSFKRPRERVEALGALLSLNVVALSGILIFGLYLLSWRTGGFTQIVSVNRSFIPNVVVLVILTFFAGSVAYRSWKLLVRVYSQALSEWISRCGARDDHLPWVVRRATRYIFGTGYGLFSFAIILVLVLVIAAYSASDAVDRVLSYSNPLLSAFGSSPLAMLAVILLTSRFDRFAEHIADDYARLQS